MLSKLLTFGGLIVGGIIIADIWIHPAGTQAASAGAVSVEKPLIQGLLGSVPA